MVKKITKRNRFGTKINYDDIKKIIEIKSSHELKFLFNIDEFKLVLEFLINYDIVNLNKFIEAIRESPISMKKICDIINTILDTYKLNDDTINNFNLLYYRLFLYKLNSSLSLEQAIIQKYTDNHVSLLGYCLSKKTEENLLSKLPVNIRVEDLEIQLFIQKLKDIHEFISIVKNGSNLDKISRNDSDEIQLDYILLYNRILILKDNYPTLTFDKIKSNYERLEIYKNFIKELSDNDDFGKLNENNGTSQLVANTNEIKIEPLVSIYNQAEESLKNGDPIDSIIQSVDKANGIKKVEQENAKKIQCIEELNQIELQKLKKEYDAKFEAAKNEAEKERLEDNYKTKTKEIEIESENSKKDVETEYERKIENIKKFTEFGKSISGIYIDTLTSQNTLNLSELNKYISDIETSIKSMNDLNTDLSKTIYNEYLSKLKDIREIKINEASAIILQRRYRKYKERERMKNKTKKSSLPIQSLPPQQQSLIVEVEKIDEEKNILINDLSEILCKINKTLLKIKEANKNIKDLNSVFCKRIKKDDYEFYTNGQIKNYLNDVSTKTNEEIKNVLKIHKDNYEILKGPVRVYLNIKPKTRSEKLQVIDKKGDYTIELQNSCFEQFDKNEKRNFINYINPNSENLKKINFSRVYENPNSDVVFKDSLEDTISNMIGNSNQIVMAYGPSGSGKTYNLIGQDFESDKAVHGIIRHALYYLMNRKDVSSIKVKSYQYYNTCDTTIKSDTKKLNSFNAIYDFRDLINKITNNNVNVKDYLNELNGKIEDSKSIYKYMQSKEDITSTQIKFINLDEKFHENLNKLYKTESVPGIKTFPKINFYTSNSKETEKFIYCLENDRIKSNDNRFNAMKLTELLKTFTGENCKLDGLHVTIDINNTPTEIDLNEYKDKTVQDFINLNILVPTKEEGKSIKISLDFLSKKAKKKNFLNISMSILHKLVNYYTLYSSKFIFKNYSDDEIEIPKYSNENDVELFLSKLYTTVEKNRPTRGTPLNPESSRSHLLYEFKITSDSKENTLTFIDLAGNEKADENLFQMRKEGDGIISSLLAIKEVLKMKQSEGLENSYKFNDFFPDQSKDSIIQYLSYKGNENSCLSLDSSVFNINLDHFKEIMKEDNTTVSMYLNLPGYTFDKSITSKNRCEAIGDSLHLVNDLLEKTKISQYVESAKEDVIKCIQDNKTISSFGMRKSIRRKNK